MSVLHSNKSLSPLVPSNRLIALGQRGFCATRSPRHALTLMELLIVLTILAVLTTMAVQLTEGVIDQGRFDASRNGLEEIRDAVIGPADAEAGPGSGGFVADMGRPPATLGELITGTYSYALQALDTDGDSILDGQLASGWRGPYLRLPAGRSALMDGWGNPFLLQNVAGTLTLVSQGSDRDSVNPENGYRADISLIIAADDYLGAVRFHVREMEDGAEIDPDLDSDDVLELRIFRVNPLTAQVHPPELVTFQSTDTPPTFSHQLMNVAVGPLAARAVLKESAAGAIKKKSAVLYLTLTPRANLLKKLILQ
jgi:prepilin-type N-terminal cleavage/methylation domain-containing protein